MVKTALVAGFVLVAALSLNWVSPFWSSYLSVFTLLRALGMVKEYTGLFTVATWSPAAEE